MNRIIRALPVLVSAFALLGISLYVEPVAAQKQLVVVSFGGDTKKREEWAFYQPFEKETGIRVITADYNGGLSQIKAQVESGAVQWDVFVGETALALQGCAQNLLEDISKWELAPGPGGKSAKDDYVAGAIVPCGVGFNTWSTVIAYQKSLPTAPTSVADFFDLKKFPGKRSMYKNPIYTLEFALLADGVPASDVYKVLATKQGVDRAFRKLDTIKKDVVWWESWTQSMQLLADKETVMGVSSSTRLRIAIRQRGVPVVILPVNQQINIDGLMVPKGAKNLEAAKQYVKFVSRPDIHARIYRSADQWKSETWPVRPISFPVRLSVLNTTQWEEGDQEIATPLLSGTPERAGSIVSNAQFWADHREELDRRFHAWLQK